MSQKLIGANFHIHTNASPDGYNSFSSLYKLARRAGIDVLCITDHDTRRGGTAFKSWLRSRGVTDLEVVVGEEVTCSDGTHVIGFPLTADISPRRPPDVAREIRDQGGFVYFPHPARKDGIINSAFCDETLVYGDFFEAFNAKIPDDLNAGANEFDFGPLRPLAGSDAHYNADIGKCVCQLEHRGDLASTLRHYQATGRVRIFATRKLHGDANYFPLYYKIKPYLPLPAFAKTAAKRLIPPLVNFKQRNFVPSRTVIYDSLEVQPTTHTV